jgi:hypothetical protein
MFNWVRVLVCGTGRSSELQITEQSILANILGAKSKLSEQSRQPYNKKTIYKLAPSQTISQDPRFPLSHNIKSRPRVVIGISVRISHLHWDIKPSKMLECAGGRRIQVQLVWIA